MRILFTRSRCRNAEGSCRESNGGSRAIRSDLNGERRASRRCRLRLVDWGSRSRCHASCRRLSSAGGRQLSRGEENSLRPEEGRFASPLPANSSAARLSSGLGRDSSGEVSLKSSLKTGARLREAVTRRRVSFEEEVECEGCSPDRPRPLILAPM